MSFQEIPNHLKKYIAHQNSNDYNPVEHATWRFILRQLKDFLEENAHPFYLEGLKKSGIEVDKIPNIQDISAKLEDYGWRCVPVSGFLPPAAFMELQALGYLPIAKEIRVVQHIPYTPAPDIVHEAAGHAPYLPHPAFADYLHNYAQVSKKCIVSSEDYAVYKAIRDLSDVKESTDDESKIKEAEQKLEKAIKSVSYVSEATKVSRLFWWTAEYGLIGDIDSPKIFGAGLLSSIGEATNCLKAKVKKIPLTLDCVNYSYDITEQQPQLFVARDFEHLNEVLEEMCETFSFRMGGTKGLEEAKKAKTVNTAELNSGLQISGLLVDYRSQNNQAYYLRFQGPTQLSFEDKQLEGHGKDYHKDGYSTVVDKLVDTTKCLSDMSLKDLSEVGLQSGEHVVLRFCSGIVLEGTFIKLLQQNGKNLLLTFENCSVKDKGETLFDPRWGTFDLGLGVNVKSVYSGPADSSMYGETETFEAVAIPAKKPNEKDRRRFFLYQKVRDLRNAFTQGQINPSHMAKRASELYNDLARDFPDDWLIQVELLELAYQFPSEPEWKAKIVEDLLIAGKKYPHLADHINNGIKLAPHLVI